MEIDEPSSDLPEREQSNAKDFLPCLEDLLALGICFDYYFLLFYVRLHHIIAVAGGIIHYEVHVASNIQYP